MRVELNESVSREDVPWNGDQLWPMIGPGDTLCFLWGATNRQYCLPVVRIDLEMMDITLKMHNNTLWDLKVHGTLTDGCVTVSLDLLCD